MSFLDIDERLLDLAPLVDLVYSPLVDLKEFPEMADVTLIEGAVSSKEDYEKIRKVRAHTKILVSLGDCAVTANVPGMRNPFKVEEIMNRAYIENVDRNPPFPSGDSAFSKLGACASVVRWMCLCRLPPSAIPSSLSSRTSCTRYDRQNKVSVA